MDLCLVFGPIICKEDYADLVSRAKSQVHKLSFSAKMFVYLLRKDFQGCIIAFARGGLAIVYLAYSVTLRKQGKPKRRSVSSIRKFNELGNSFERENSKSYYFIN